MALGQQGHTVTSDGGRTSCSRQWTHGRRGAERGRARLLQRPLAVKEAPGVGRSMPPENRSACMACHFLFKTPSWSFYSFYQFLKTFYETSWAFPEKPQSWCCAFLCVLLRSSPPHSSLTSPWRVCAREETDIAPWLLTTLCTLSRFDSLFH